MALTKEKKENLTTLGVFSLIIGASLMIIGVCFLRDIVGRVLMGLGILSTSIGVILFKKVGVV